jgi:hypothetical protein
MWVGYYSSNFGNVSQYTDQAMGSTPGTGKERIFLVDTSCRPALRPTQPHVQWVPGVLSPEEKRPGREAGHSAPSTAEVKEA